MNDLKKFQLEMKKQFPFEPDITDDFPPYLFYEASCHLRHDRGLVTGLALSYGSTGGRVQYRDYSGYLRTDQILRYLNLSAPLGFGFDPGERTSIQFDLRPTYTMTFTDLKFEQEVAGNHQTESHRFKSQNIAVQPEFAMMRRINQFGIHVQASYYITVVKGKMYYKENDEAYLVGNDDKPLYAGWDGVRLSFGVSLVLADK
jgi:hypothetical protein